MTQLALVVALWLAPVARAQDEPDAADVYRTLSTELMEADPEARLRGWEAYLEQFPDSPLRPTIEAQIFQAESELYGGISKEVVEDPGKRLIPFPEGATLENLNPATRVRAGFAFGLPDYLNLQLDGEYALNSRFSAHLGVRRRLSGWAIELGPRVALLKREQLGLIVSAAADLCIGANPAIFGLRPTLMAGIQPVDALSFQVQGSVQGEVNHGVWSPRYRGGANLTVRLASPVAAYAETLLETKYVNWHGGGFRFYLGVFGLRFYPATKAKRPDMVDALIGGEVPYYFSYWDQHKGAAMAHAAVYLE